VRLFFKYFLGLGSARGRSNNKKILDLALDGLGTTSDTASTAGGNQTDLLTGRSITANGRGVTNVLLVTTTVGVLNRVHGHTTHDGPAVALGLVLVESTASLQQRLVDTATTSDDTNGTTAVRLHDLLGTRGQAETSGVVVGVVGNDGHVVTRGTSEFSAVTGALLDVGDDGTFGQGTKGQHVADLQLSLLAAVQELTGVQTLDGNEVLLHLLELVGVAEDNAGQRSTTSRVVDDLPHDTLDVAVTLGIVQAAELGSALAVLVVGLED